MYRLAVALITIAASGCDVFGSNKLRILNHTGVPITEVYVEFAGHRVAAKDIGVGASVTIGGSAPRDGLLILEYVLAGRPVRSEISYIAPPIPTSCEIVISQDSFTRSCKS
jgi:hypothetical protein